MGELKTKGLRIATRCTSIDQFIAAFHRFCDAQTVFISTLSARAVGLETPFSIELADHSPALRGIGVVVESWATPKNPFGRPGLQLGIRRLTADSEKVFERLLAAQDAVVKPQTTQLAAVVVRAQTPRPFVQTEPSPVVPPPEPRPVLAAVPVAPARSVVTAPIGSSIGRAIITPPSASPITPPSASPIAPSARSIVTPPAGSAKVSATTPPAGSPAVARTVTPPAGSARPPLPNFSTTTPPGGAAKMTPNFSTTTPPGGAAKMTPNFSTTTPPGGSAKLSPTALLPKIVPAIPHVTNATPAGASPVVVAVKPAVGGADGGTPLVFESDTGVFNAAIAAATGQFGGAAAAPISEDDAPRTPGSELVLPANPLMNLTDDSLEGFVDCTLYEETGNFFPAPEDTFALGGEDDDVIGPPSSATMPPPFGADEAPEYTQSRGGPPRREPTAALLAIAAPLEMPLPRHATATSPALTAPTAGELALGAVWSRPTPPPMPSERPPTATATDAHPIGETTTEARALAADYRPLASASELEAFASDSRPSDSRPSDSRPTHSFAPEYTSEGTPYTDAPAEIRSYPPEPQPYYGDAPAPRATWRTSKLLAGKRRRWVLGGAGVATATIAIALIVAMRSGSSEPARAAGKGAADLVAQNAAVPLVGEHARLSKPVTDAKPGEDGEATTVDTGAAPVVGTGPCKVAVSTTPAGSIISVDGEQVGPSPITVGGPCTKRKIDVAHPRYQTTTRYVTPKADAVETLEVTLPRPTHDLYVDTQPSGATVSIDGHRAGTSPTAVKIMGFTTLTLTIEKPGYKPETKKLYSKTARDRVTFKLGRDRAGSLTDMLKH